MKINTTAIHDVVFTILRLAQYDYDRAWKDFDWMCLTDIYECGFIHNPLNKANSVLLAEEGLGKNYGEEQSWIKDAAIC